MPTLVPSADRAPSLASRVVTIHATDVAEGAPAPDSFTFSLRRALRVPADDVILRPGGVPVRLVDGRAQIRLPVYSAAVQTVDGSSDWGIVVTPSWGEEYMIRVPAGTSTISLADLPEVRPLTRYERDYAISGVALTVKEGTQAGGTASYVNGIVQMSITVPSFRPQTVYPYIDQTADARAQHYEQQIRADLDDRLEEVTTAYELAVELGFTGTLQEWLASLRGPKGDASTVPGPPNVLTVGTVTTGAAGSQASASITGTAPNQTLGLTIPRGDKGDKGDRGPVSTVPGPTGKSAYQYAVEGGYTGTEQQFAEAVVPDVIAWPDVEDKPTAFPPETHTHTQAQVDGLDDRLDAIEADTDWVPITLRSGFPEQSGFSPEIRRIGSVVYLRGGVNGSALSATNTSYIVGDIPATPAGLRPATRDLYLMGASSQANFAPLVVLHTSGAITIRTAAVLGGYYLLDPINFPN